MNARGIFVFSALLIFIDGVSVYNCGHILVNFLIPWTPLTLWHFSFFFLLHFHQGALNLTEMLLKFFLSFLFSSSNFCCYQFNSYIYVNASQIHILLQIFSRHLFNRLLYSYCISQCPYVLPSNQLPISYLGFLCLWGPFPSHLGSNKVTLHSFLLHHWSSESWSSH